MTKKARMSNAQIPILFFIVFVLLFSLLDKGEREKFLEKEGRTQTGKGSVP